MRRVRSHEQAVAIEGDHVGRRLRSHEQSVASRVLTFASRRWRSHEGRHVSHSPAVEGVRKLSVLRIVFVSSSSRSPWPTSAVMSSCGHGAIRTYLSLPSDQVAVGRQSGRWTRIQVAVGETIKGRSKPPHSRGGRRRPSCARRPQSRATRPRGRGVRRRPDGRACSRA